jgi:glutamyl-tRNA reductase
MHILTLGLNHRTAPVQLREKLAFPESSLQTALPRLTGEYGLAEAAILSTCNRSEIYVASDNADGLSEARRFLNEVHGVDVAQLQPHFYELSNEGAATHLFGVACGIDSMVIGESQILKQVRDALELAQRNGSARIVLNELFQRSLRVGKRARSETDIGRGRLSISTAAVELASQIFESLEDRRGMLVGAGEMGELTAQYLMDAGIGALLVANRTRSRADELATRFGAQAIEFIDLQARLAEVDVVITSTAASGFVVTKEMVRGVMKARMGRPLIFIDIAVPRDVEPEVRVLDNVFVFDIDNLEQVVAVHREEREREISNVQSIIQTELGGFLTWFNALSTGPLIRALRQHSQQLQETELRRWQSKLEQLTPEEREAVIGLLRGYGNKLLHDPLVQIREFANSEDGYLHLDTVRRLFSLDQFDLDGDET